MQVERERIRELIKRTPYLAVDTLSADAKLIPPAAVFAMLGDGRHYVMDLSKGLPKIEGLLDRDEYSLRDIAKVAGVKYMTAYAWIYREAVLTPSVREMGNGRGRHAVYSYADAFVAGILGSLRRYQMPVATMRKIQPLFTKNQTASGMLTPARS